MLRPAVPRAHDSFLELRSGTRSRIIVPNHVEGSSPAACGKVSSKFIYIAHRSLRFAAA